jgi:hypothetical protein
VYLLAIQSLPRLAFCGANSLQPSSGLGVECGDGVPRISGVYDRATWLHSYDEAISISSNGLQHMEATAEGLYDANRPLTPSKVRRPYTRACDWTLRGRQSGDW